MKIVCISKNTKSKKLQYQHLTINKIYEASDWDRWNWMIRDDSGEVAIYKKKNFKTLREDNVNKILDE